MRKVITLATAACFGLFAATSITISTAEAKVVYRCARGSVINGVAKRTGSWHACSKKDPRVIACVHHRTEKFRHYGHCKTPSN